MGETWGPLEAGDRAEGVLSLLCGQKVVTEPRRARKGAPGTAILGLHLERGQ